MKLLALALLFIAFQARADTQSLPGIPAPGQNPNAGLNPAAQPYQAPAPIAAPQPQPTGINPRDDDPPAPSLGAISSSIAPAPVAPLAPPTQLDKLQCLSMLVGEGLKKKEGEASTPYFDGLKERAAKLMADSSFMQALKDMFTYPNRKNMFMVQICLFVVILLVKKQLQATATNMFSRAFFGILCNLALLGTVSYLVPRIFIGEPFQVVTSSLYKLFAG